MLADIRASHFATAYTSLLPAGNIILTMRKMGEYSPFAAQQKKFLLLIVIKV